MTGDMVVELNKLEKECKELLDKREQLKRRFIKIVKNSFWDNLGQNKNSTQNNAIIDDAIEHGIKMTLNLKNRTYLGDVDNE
jgi:oligoendopeptidase F